MCWKRKFKHRHKDTLLLLACCMWEDNEKKKKKKKKKIRLGVILYVGGRGKKRPTRVTTTRTGEGINYV